MHANRGSTGQTSTPFALARNAAPSPDSQTGMVRYVASRRRLASLQTPCGRPAPVCPPAGTCLRAKAMASDVRCQGLHPGHRGFSSIGDDISRPPCHSEANTPPAGPCRGSETEVSSRRPFPVRELTSSYRPVGIATKPPEKVTPKQGDVNVSPKMSRPVA